MNYHAPVAMSCRPTGPIVSQSSAAPRSSGPLTTVPSPTHTVMHSRTYKPP